MGIKIRQMTEHDIEGIVNTFAVWHKYRPQYEQYFAEQKQGGRVVLVALDGDKVAGYTTILWESGYEPFKAAGIPEISDLNVITAYQKRGIGTSLIRACEQIVREHGKPVIGIGVGLTADYGAAQHLYPQLGYIFDGRGVQGEELYLTKDL